jgi:putative sigma-54 modulation protein
LVRNTSNRARGDARAGTNFREPELVKPRQQQATSMQIFVRGKNLHITDPLREYAEEKIGHLDHYIDHGILDAHVTMRTERNDQIVDVVLNLRHYLIKAEERSATMYASIDLVKDRLEQQIRKYKTRRRERHHRQNGKTLSANEGVLPEDKEIEHFDDVGEAPRIVRTKQFAVKPMDAEEAVHQMELLGHDFFVFVNAETEAVNVLYKRKSGDLGLIEPTR